ncbi:DUF4932 domain-containing protein [Xanthocytophaga flava]|uniref:DUF4932 domain-containing protein n=1 Tax=Xanthocytophaga flava TaxID=3048013 RepID=UPI0028D05219|nr:DUF4932 domain-containing protein [Xanthocytophaga flavus]MDJ1469357.1 DUF4932 domain-containing protein [Xanthocytophaga flavus]
MKTLSAAIPMLFFFVHSVALQAQSTDNQLVRLSETYELANIILALTEYGKTDPWEVEQHSDYYKEVRAYFASFASHPLLAKANYSREKWDSYLSFRTDAYAFSLDKNNCLIRNVVFRTIEERNAFEENKDLINDFVQVTNFREFYAKHLPYYQTLATTYLESQQYTQIFHFLEQEFGQVQDTAHYAIVMSPLVGRMNCHRVVNDVQTDFITLPAFILKGKSATNASQEDIATGIHMLFTELDHAFVNPVTYHHRQLLKENFNNAVWDAGSGYETDSLATFNEYMTWAAYDIYIRKFFPEVANQVCTNWTLQNETRGFYASTLFTQELINLYDHRKSGQRIKDLYPALLKCLGKFQHTISKPLITYCNLDNQTISDTLATYKLRFSEPMQNLLSFDIIRVIEQDGKSRQQKFEITQQKNSLRWTEKNTELQFTLPLVKGQQNRLILNYAWKVRTPLKSRKGITLKPYTSIKTTVQ